MIDVWQLISYGLWIAISAGLAAFIYGVMLRVLGLEDYLKYVSSGLAAILTAAFGWSIIQALYSGVTPPVPYGWVFYAVAGALLVASAIYLALGRSEGCWSLMGALLIVGVGFFTTSLAAGIDIGVGGSISVTLAPSTTLLKNYEELELTIIPQGGNPPYESTVNWGDGVLEVEVIYDEATLVHKYSVPSDKAADSFTIRVDVLDSQGRKGFNTMAVVVQNQDYCPFEWPWNAFCSFYRAVSAVLPAIDLQKLTECPLFPSNGKLYDLYQFILEVSMSALGLFLAFNIAWRVISGGDVVAAVVESIKDSIVVIALAFLAPHVYNATAGILNTVVYQLAGRINIGWVFSWIMLQIALGVALGYFIPFMAQYGALLTFTLFLASVTVYIRYVLILTIVAASPLLSAAYLHPAFKGVVRHVATLLAGLMLAGPLAAVFLVVLNYVVPGQDVVFGVIYPLIVGVLPSILGVFGAGAVQSLSKAVVGGLKPVSGVLSVRVHSKSFSESNTATTLNKAEAPTTPKVIKLRVPTTSITQASRHVEAEATASMKPGPIITPGMVRAAVKEASMKRGVYETLAEAQRLTPGIAFVEEGLSAVKQASGEALGEKVHPLWEGFKAFTSELSRTSWKQLKTNIRGFATEYWRSMRSIVEREIGVKLPETMQVSLRKSSMHVESIDRHEQRRAIRDLSIK